MKSLAGFITGGQHCFHMIYKLHNILEPSGKFTIMTRWNKTILHFQTFYKQQMSYLQKFRMTQDKRYIQR